MSVFENIKSMYNLFDHIKSDIEFCVKIFEEETIKLKELNKKSYFENDNDLNKFESAKNKAEKKIENTKESLKSYLPQINDLFEAIPFEEKEFCLYGDQNTGQSIFKQDKKLLLITKRILGVESKSETELLLDLKRIEDIINP